MREAILYEKVGDRVKCRLCPHRCTISEAKRGLCGVRENMGGVLYSMVFGKPAALHIDPIEKKPLFHFLPGTATYSVSTVGCNLRCQHCQNWEISQAPKEGGLIEGEDIMPEEIVEAAVRTRCKSISYTYTEPTIFMEYALDTSKLAVQKGLKNVFVSNGYMTEDAIEAVSPYLHADNVDLKAFTDKFYRDVCGASLEPVLSTLKSLVRRKVWVEVTTLIIPTLNDDRNELKQIAQFIKGELGDFVPWHVSSFHPDYKLTSLPPTDALIIRDAVRIGKEEGLKYVYAGNVPHGDYENTYCPKCGKLLIERHGFKVSNIHITCGKCGFCNEGIEGVWE
jgi:pyruvate formate lyase activating enzyme